MVRAVIHRLFPATVIAAPVGVPLAAVTAPTVKFSDTKLANGLRVIISENHAGTDGPK